MTEALRSTQSQLLEEHEHASGARLDAGATVMTAQDWAGQVRMARQQQQAGAGTVLDVLLRGHDIGPLSEALPRHTGVEVLLNRQAYTPMLARWSSDQAAQVRAVLLQDASGACSAACADPWDAGVLKQLAQAAGAPLVQVLAVTQQDLDAWLGGASLSHNQAADLPAADGPVVQFVNQALKAGFLGGASDVHFECDREGVTVKHRLDGVMVYFARMSGQQSAQEVISRLKVMALLDITERRLPQDGRFRMDVSGQGQVIDLRVSIMPSVHGEDAVLRLLDKAQMRGAQASQNVTLAHLGFSSSDAELLHDLAQLPNGMLLVTGPTGSGKTTTVYALLSEINTGQEKIITIEDPVEYELPGVLQIPVNERKGLTFAKGLRSILRHDPDRILVGEIRDAETAEIAIQSALTGHLVFTTVHANSISDIIGRFRHFDLDMFGFMSALNGVVVQRLLRRLCPQCVQRRPPLEHERRWLQRLGYSDASSLPAAQGCEACHGTGYRGRFVLAEVHQVTDHLRDLIVKGAPISDIKADALRQGVRSLLVQAWDHIQEGTTTLDEVRRVVGGAA